jgi:hypothetical protein
MSEDLIDAVLDHIRNGGGGISVHAGEEGTKAFCWHKMEEAG